MTRRLLLVLMIVSLGRDASSHASDDFPIRFDLSDGPSEVVTAVAFRPDDSILASVRDYTKLRLWDTRTGKLVARIDGYAAGIGHGSASIPPQAFRFSPDGKLLAGGVSFGFETEGSTFLWDVSEPASIRRVAILKGHTRGVTAVAFSPDGRNLFSAGLDGEIREWDVATLKERRKLAGHPNRILTMDLSADGKHIATGDPDQVKVWEVATGIERASWKIPNLLGLAMTRDGAALAVRTSDATLQFWNLGTGQPLARSELRPDDVRSAIVRAQHQALLGSVRSAAYSHDGRMLATGGYSDLGQARLLLRDASSDNARSPSENAGARRAP